MEGGGGVLDGLLDCTLPRKESIPAARRLLAELAVDFCSQLFC